MRRLCNILLITQIVVLLVSISVASGDGSACFNVNNTTRSESVLYTQNITSDQILVAGNRGAFLQNSTVHGRVLANEQKIGFVRVFEPSTSRFVSNCELPFEITAVSPVNYLKHFISVVGHQFANSTVHHVVVLYILTCDMKYVGSDAFNHSSSFVLHRVVVEPIAFSGLYVLRFSAEHYPKTQTIELSIHRYYVPEIMYFTKDALDNIDFEATPRSDDPLLPHETFVKFLVIESKGLGVEANLPIVAQKLITHTYAVAGYVQVETQKTNVFMAGFPKKSLSWAFVLPTTLSAQVVALLPYESRIGWTLEMDDGYLLVASLFNPRTDAYSSLIVHVKSTGAYEIVREYLGTGNGHSDRPVMAYLTHDQQELFVLTESTRYRVGFKNEGLLDQQYPRQQYSVYGHGPNADIGVWRFYTTFAPHGSTLYKGFHENTVNTIPSLLPWDSKSHMPLLSFDLVGGFGADTVDAFFVSTDRRLFMVDHSDRGWIVGENCDQVQQQQHMFVSGNVFQYAVREGEYCYNGDFIRNQTGMKTGCEQPALCPTNYTCPGNGHKYEMVEPTPEVVVQKTVSLYSLFLSFFSFVVAIFS